MSQFLTSLAKTHVHLRHLPKQDERLEFYHCPLDVRQPAITVTLAQLKLFSLLKKSNNWNCA